MFFTFTHERERTHTHTQIYRYMQRNLDEDTERQTCRSVHVCVCYHVPTCIFLSVREEKGAEKVHSFLFQKRIGFVELHRETGARFLLNLHPMHASISQHQFLPDKNFPRIFVVMRAEILNIQTRIHLRNYKGVLEDQSIIDFFLHG